MHPTPSSADALPPSDGLSAWADLALGTEPTVRRAVTRWLLTAQFYVIALALMFLSAWAGFSHADTVIWLSLYCATGMAGFYVVLRSGLASHLEEPTLSFPQALFGVSAICLSYGLSEFSRTSSLQLLFLLVVFDMHRLNQRQTNILTFGSAALLLLIFGALAWAKAPGFSLHTEVYNVALAAIILPQLSLLAREIRRLRGLQIQQRTELATALERVREKAMRDGLTGLYNRRQTLAVLEAAAKRLQRHPPGFCVAILDLDHFKHINDHFGHHTGDAVLKAFADAAHRTLRDTDVIGRWGGEEFVIMLHDTDAQTGALALQRLRQAVAAHPWAELAEGLNVTFSAGFAPHPVNDDVTHTLGRADHALYDAKRQGRDQVMLATEPSPEPEQKEDVPA